MKRTEGAFEDGIEAHLLANGYRSGSHEDYDRDRALLVDELIGFIGDTQPDVWEKLRGIHDEKLEERFLESLDKDFRQRGCLDVIRHGFKFYGQRVRLAYFKPASGINPEIVDLYHQNRLTVVRQVRYETTSENSIDLVLFLNGIPVVTAELKNPMTGQTYWNAIKQYKNDRDPQAPIFRFKQRALVHFAVDPDEVYMVTELRGKKTFFLPFNKGYRTGGGNPPVEGKHKTHYLWEDVWEWHSLLDIIGRFVHLEEEEKRGPNGKPYTVVKMIFPRYHQLDCVRKMVASSEVHGAGKNYLVQHSTGSGKSNSIAWLAHRLSSLHDEDDEKVYDSVVVVTDRRVLDQQLQDTIYQLEHKQGVVKRIDKDSSQLAKALETGAPIIITTLHKFPFVTEKIDELPDRDYAIIVDEAHSSQSGEMAAEMKKVLSGDDIPDELRDEVEGLSEDSSAGDAYSAALTSAYLRGPRENLSFFAFTATPKYKTLEMFGHMGPDGMPAPFHLYSMKQAIEEGFILDVLKNYTTYDTYFGLVKKIDADPKLDKRKASKALARFLSLHPHNVSQKTEVIIEHFRHNVVTGSRLHAARYKKAFDKYIEDKGYENDIRCLVAFSGTVEDPESGESYTEPGMNDGIKETELPEKFATDAYKVLIVANKYQTGFDQPLLHTMYVDKRLSGIQAVQTLSRLNRTAPGKDDTFVLDFVNDRDDILEAFKPYYEQTSIDEELDPQKLYELDTKLREFRIFQWQEVENFGKVFFSKKTKASDNARLNGFLDPAVDRFQQANEEKQDDFRTTLRSFIRVYSFLSQIIPFTDAELEMLYAYGRMLSRKLPRRGEEAEDVDLGEDVALKFYRIQKASEGSIDLEGGGTVSGPKEVGTGKQQELEIELSRLIDLLNDRFGTEFTEADQLFFDQTVAEMKADDSIRKAALANTEENFRYPAEEKFKDVLVGRHEDNEKLVNRVFGDEDFGETVIRLLLKRVYDEIRVRLRRSSRVIFSRTGALHEDEASLDSRYHRVEFCPHLPALRSGITVSHTRMARRCRRWCCGRDRAHCRGDQVGLTPADRRTDSPHGGSGWSVWSGDAHRNYHLGRDLDLAVLQPRRLGGS